MKKILTFFLLLGMSHIFPIELKPSCENMNFKPIFDFYSNNKLSVISAGRGYTGIAATGNLGSVNLNPASLDIANTMQAYYEYGLKNNYTLHENTFYEKDLGTYKAGACYGAAYKINARTQVGLIYNKIKSYRADYDRVYNYDTIGRPYEYFDVYEKVATSVLSFPVSYQAFDFLRLGVGVNINIYHAETSRVCLNDEYLYEHFNGEIDFVLFRPKLGAVARFNDHISVGTTLILPSSKRIKECVFWKEIKYEKNAFPLEFGFGSKIDLGWIPLSLLVDYNYSNEAANREFVDSHQAGIGLECGILPSLQLRTGYLYQNDFRDLDYLEDGSCFWCDNTSYEQMFFTGGATFRWRKTSWDVAVMQSGFTSDLSQTYFKMGVTLDLEQR